MSARWRLEQDRTPAWRVATMGLLHRFGARSRVAHVREGALHYFEVGPGEGSPVLFLHGLGGDAEGLTLLATTLSEERRCLVPDLFDLSPRSLREEPPGGAAPLGVRDHADAIAGWLSALGATEVDVVGVSLGAWIGAWLALRTDVVRRMLLVTPAGARMDRDELDELARLAGLSDVRPLAQRMLGAGAPLGWPGIDRTIEATLRACLEGDRVARFVAAIGDDDWLDEPIRGLSAGVEFLAATEDRIVGRDGPRRLIERAPGARATWAVGAEHGLVYQWPAEVLGEIRRILGLPRARTTLGLALHHLTPRVARLALARAEAP